MTDTTLRVVYRPTTHDIVDQRLEVHDAETVDLVEWEEVPAGEYCGRHVRGRTADGLDVVVHLGSGRVRTREGDSGAYRTFAGYVDKLQGVAVDA